MIEFHPAKPEDIAAIVSLVNQTYRGEQSRLGWTTEADLLDGLRTDQAHMASLVNAQDSRVLLAKQGDELL